MIYKLNHLVGNMAEDSRDSIWTLFRMLSSAMFMTHGYGKLFGDNPQPFQGAGMTSINIGEVLSFATPMDINALFIAGCIEFFGGLLIFIGLWTHLAALFAVLLMTMAYLTAHLAWFPTMNNGELAAMYFLNYLVILYFGPGPYSADTWLEVRRQEKRQEKLEQHSIDS